MAGISILRRLLMKEAVIKNAPFQNEGIMSISKALATNVDSKVNKMVESAKRQGIDFDKYNEQEIKYILELNKPKGPRVISQGDPEFRKITEAMLGRKEGKVIKADFGKPFAEEMVTTERVITDIKKLEPIEAMKEANRVLKGEGRYKNLSQVDREKIVNDESVTDHIFERNVPIDPEDMAEGGRAGFKMGRRAFLKLMGGAAAGIGALKTGALKMFGKEGAKKVATDVVTTPPVAGKPAWFDSLVNKVIAEGDDVTKQFAYKDRMQVNTKQISPTEEVTVYRDLDDGSVRVEYNSADNLAEGPVELQFKPGMADETTKGKPPDEFTASEAEPEIVNWDGDIEGTGENLVDNVADLTSDTTKLKEYAVGKEKITIKEMVESINKKKKTQKINEDPLEQVNYIENKEGYSPMEYIDESERVGAFENRGYETKGMNLPQKKASGGIARMLGE